MSRNNFNIRLNYIKNQISENLECICFSGFLSRFQISDTAVPRLFLRADRNESDHQRSVRFHFLKGSIVICYTGNSKFHTYVSCCCTIISLFCSNFKRFKYADPQREIDLEGRDKLKIQEYQEVSRTDELCEDHD